MRRPTAWLAAQLAASFVLLSATAGSAADPVKIGFLWPLTGNAAAAGQAAKAAAEVAAEIVNNPHPELKGLPLAESAGLPNLGGAKLELVFIDHQGNPSVAQQQALRLVTQDKVHVLFGAYQSSCTLTATPVAERYGIPFVVGDSAALNITARGFKWMFRVTPIATDFAAAYMRFFDDMKQGRQARSARSRSSTRTPITAPRSPMPSRPPPRRRNITVADAHSLQREHDRRLGAGAAAQGEAARRGDLHQLHGGCDPLHEDDEEPRLHAADGARRRFRLLRSVVHPGGRAISPRA